MVLDLRDNDGGALRQANQALGLFLRSRRLYSFRTLAGEETTVDAPTTSVPRANRLVLIMNRNTASAAEIFTSALQETRRATVVGETTFGKGRANAELLLPNGGMLMFSNAVWTTSLGRDIDRQGLIPDIQVPDDRFPWPGELQINNQSRTSVGAPPRTTDGPLTAALTAAHATQR